MSTTSAAPASSARVLKPRATFITEALRQCRENTGRGFARAADWRDRSVNWTQASLAAVAEWAKENKGPLIVVPAVLIWLGLMGWFIHDWMHGKVDPENPVQTGVGGLFASAIIGLVVSPLLSLGLFLALLVLTQLFRAFMPIAVLLPLLVWTPLYVLVQVLIVGAKLLLLVPLALLMLVTRAIELKRRIFYTCPVRGCSHRGLPVYVCPECGSGHRGLWPSLYGLLSHRCEGCGERLPTLDVLGRNQLTRRCGGTVCGGIPLVGKHAGKARERLVAIKGGPGSGKTCYLHAVVDQITSARNGKVALTGEIDDDDQAEEFMRVKARLGKGQPPPKSSAVAKAFLLFAQAGRSRCQLYLYDAPGEELVSIDSAMKLQYLPLLEGIIFLVDPMNLGGSGSVGGSSALDGMSFHDVVVSTVQAGRARTSGNGSKKMPMRAAVVISKADLEPVKAQIGDVRRGSVSAEKCREAIIRWGGGKTLNILHEWFQDVRYFACSPLGRSAEAGNRGAFKGVGVVEPLEWVLGEAS